MSTIKVFIGDETFDINVKDGMSRHDIENTARRDLRIVNALVSKRVSKIVVVPGKSIDFVTGE